MRFSVEAFPPRSDKGITALRQTIKKLASFRAEFLSVTCGAGGSDNDDSTEVIEMAKGSDVRFVPHITMSNVSRSELMSKVQRHETSGASGFVALRGDATAHPAGLKDVRELIREIASNSSSRIFCAGYPDPHPDSMSHEKDMEWLRGKAEAGADEIITQYTFNIGTLARFRDGVAEIAPRMRIRPGVMLIKDLWGILRFSERSGVPVSLIGHLDGKIGEDFIRASADLTARFIEDMVREGFDAFHAYALNDHRILSELNSMGALTPSDNGGMKGT